MTPETRAVILNALERFAEDVSDHWPPEDVDENIRLISAAIAEVKAAA